MEKPTTTNLMQYIKQERIILGIVGWYTLANGKYRILQNISIVFFGIFIMLYGVLGLIDVLINLTDVLLLAQLCSFVLTEWVGIGKVVNIIYYNKDILAMEDMLKNPLFTELECPEEEQTIYKSLQVSRLLKKFYLVQVIICILFQSSMVMKKKFPLIMWYPFDEYEHYYPVFFFSLIIDAISAITFVAVNILLSSLLDLCATQFILLKDRLRKVGSLNESYEITLQKLKKYVEHHNYIYRFADLIQKTFSKALFLEITSIGTIICFSAFSVLVTPIKNTEFIMLAVYTQCMIWQVAVHCWFGQKLLNKSDEVTESCYMSKWYECSLEIQKHLLIIMRRANKIVLINAVGIFPLNLQSFMNVLSWAYSFFAIIWHLYDEGGTN